MLTERECLQNAFKALLNGDTTGRDDWCRKAEHIMRQRTRFKEGGPMMPGEPIRLVAGSDGVYAPAPPVAGKE